MILLAGNIWKYFVGFACFAALLTYTYNGQSSSANSVFSADVDDDSSRYAYATLLSLTPNTVDDDNIKIQNDALLLSVRLLAFQLLHNREMSNPNNLIPIPFVVMVTDTVPQEQRDLLITEGATVVPVDRLDASWIPWKKRDRIRDGLTKFHVFELEQFTKVCYLAPTTAVVGSLSGIFADAGTESQATVKTEAEGNGDSDLSDDPSDFPNDYMLAAMGLRDLDDTEIEDPNAKGTKKPGDEALVYDSHGHLVPVSEKIADRDTPSTGVSTKAKISSYQPFETDFFVLRPDQKVYQRLLTLIDRGTNTPGFDSNDEDPAHSLLNYLHRRQKPSTSTSTSKATSKRDVSEEVQYGETYASVRSPRLVSRRKHRKPSDNSLARMPWTTFAAPWYHHIPSTKAIEHGIPAFPAWPFLQHALSNGGAGEAGGFHREDRDLFGAIPPARPTPETIVNNPVAAMPWGGWQVRVGGEIKEGDGHVDMAAVWDEWRAVKWEMEGYYVGVREVERRKGRGWFSAWWNT